LRGCAGGVKVLGEASLPHIFFFYFLWTDGCLMIHVVAPNEGPIYIRCVKFSRSTDWCDVEPITHCPFVLPLAAHRIYIFQHDILWCLFSTCRIWERS
jgi:hypothetical protein